MRRKAISTKVVSTVHVHSFNEFPTPSNVSKRVVRFKKAKCLFCSTGTKIRFTTDLAGSEADAAGGASAPPPRSGTAPAVRAFIPRYFGGIICLGQECSILIRWSCALENIETRLSVFGTCDGI